MHFGKYMLIYILLYFSGNIWTFAIDLDQLSDLVQKENTLKLCIYMHIESAFQVQMYLLVDCFGGRFIEMGKLINSYQQ